MNGETTTERNLDDADEIPEIPEIRKFTACPKTDDPANPGHNCRTTTKIVVEDDTLKLLLHLKCTCGHERRRTIG